MEICACTGILSYIGIPGPVRALSVFNVSSTSVRITWTAPEGLVEIASYKASVSQLSDGQLIYQDSIFPTSSSLSFTVTGLSEFCQDICTE